jgi:hypothetical protein
MKMRRPVAAFAFLIALAMCAFLLGTSGPARPAGAAAATKAGGGAASPVPMTALPGASTAAPAAAAQANSDATLSPDTTALDNMSACQRIITLASESPGVSVRVSVGNFKDEVADVDRSGCTITIGGSWNALGDGPSALDTISNEMTDRGWRDDPRYAEDTPGTTRFALVRGASICIFQGVWDAGNPSDSTYVPNDQYTFIIRCATPRP